MNTLQVAMATYQTVKCNRHQQLEGLSGIEKLLVQGYSEELDPFVDIQRLINTEQGKSPSERYIVKHFNYQIT